MTEPTPRLQTLSSVLFHMEGSVHDIERWGEVLKVMSESPSLVQPATLSVIAEAQRKLGQSLQAQHERAFALAQPDDKSGGGQPCA